jgi:hypothetical protein
MKNLTKVMLCLIAMLVLAMSSNGVYATVAGHVQFVYGTVQLTTEAGQTHAIQKDDAVDEWDTLFPRQQPPRKSGCKMAASSQYARRHNSSSILSPSTDSRMELRKAISLC